MNQETIEVLADAIKEYYGDYELEELCKRFNLEIDYLGNHPNHLKLVHKLFVQKEHGTNKQFLETIMPKLLRRCEERILNTTWEVNVFDEHMLPQLKKLQGLFAGNKKSVLQPKSWNRFYTTLEELTEFFSKSKTALTIVDSRIGKATLECLDRIQTPIRLLTVQGQQDSGAEFGRLLSNFRARAHDIEIRQHLKLNDRFFIFNGRCWLVSC
ncbi:MAG: hypothetical protein HKO68_16875, partial [Desulfobacterales bacterium]|nr:hypothetical protein [Desulfobacterales bacterium]